jgi:hypothetical protein
MLGEKCWARSMSVISTLRIKDAVIAFEVLDKLLIAQPQRPVAKEDANGCLAFPKVVDLGLMDVGSIIGQPCWLFGGAVFD